VTVREGREGVRSSANKRKYQGLGVPSNASRDTDRRAGAKKGEDKPEPTGEWRTGDRDRASVKSQQKGGKRDGGSREPEMEQGKKFQKKMRQIRSEADRGGRERRASVKSGRQIRKQNLVRSQPHELRGPGRDAGGAKTAKGERKEAQIGKTEEIDQRRGKGGG